jgi:putative oxidoreductase
VRRRDETGVAGGVMARPILVRVARVGAATFFIGAGLTKLIGTPWMVATFAATGVGQWLRYVTGVLEVSGGILLLRPSLAYLGALLLIGVMCGAIVAEVFVLGRTPVPALICLAVLAYIAWPTRRHICWL